MTRVMGSLLFAVVLALGAGCSGESADPTAEIGVPLELCESERAAVENECLAGLEGCGSLGCLELANECVVEGLRALGTCCYREFSGEELQACLEPLNDSGTSWNPAGE